MNLKDFINKTEDYRGKYKNKRRVHSQLKNIHLHGSKKVRRLCYESKLYGITFIEKLSSDLSKKEQKEYVGELFETYDVPSIAQAKTLLFKYFSRSQNV